MGDMINACNTLVRVTTWEHHVPLAFHSGREADHSPPSSAEVKEWVELCLHSPNAPLWRGAQLRGAQGQLYLYLSLWLEDLKGRDYSEDLGVDG
jgi:hypothetical protein